ncbi:MAG: PhnD/SsuA/transferrin family substrate-binding protein [Polyangiales bacterium]
MTVPLRFGLVPRTFDGATSAALDRIVQALANTLGVRVGVMTFPAPAELERAFARGTCNLVWCSPTLALTSPTFRKGDALATSVREGVALYHGVLITRSDSAITSPLALRGTRAAWVAPSSASGYLYARVTLAGHGIDPEDLFAREQFYGTHGGVVRAVLDGEADVGATFAVFEGGDPSRALLRAGFHEVDGSQDALRVILCTPSIPSELWVASTALVEELGRDALIDALTKLDLHAPLALERCFGCDRLERTSANDLEELRRQLFDAEALGVVAPD